MTSVTAEGSKPRKRLCGPVVQLGHAARRPRPPPPPRAGPWRAAASTRPVPSGFVRKTRVARACAELLRQSASGCTVPTTARPYFGSGSRMVCPPARTAPASCTFAAAASKIARTVSTGSSSGNAATDSATSGRPAHGEDVVQGVRGGDRAEEGRVVDHGREEVGGEDERAVVVEPVDGRVVRRSEADEQVLGRAREEAGQQLLEPGGRILRRAASSRFETREARCSLHSMEVTARHVRLSEHDGPAPARARSGAPTGGCGASGRRTAGASRPTPARMAEEHAAFREQLAAGGAEVILAETPHGPDPDAIYTYDPAHRRGRRRHPPPPRQGGPARRARRDGRRTSWRQACPSPAGWRRPRWPRAGTPSGSTSARSWSGAATGPTTPASRRSESCCRASRSSPSTSRTTTARARSCT